MQRLEHFGMRQGRAARVAGLCVEVETEMAPRRQLRFAASKIAEPQFRPLQIGEDADRPSDLGFDRADLLKSRAVLVMCAVAEIEAEHIDTCVEQSAQTVASRARGAGRHDSTGPARPGT